MNFDEKTYGLIEAYLDQTLSSSEHSSFEVRMKDDAAFFQEVKIYREMRIQYSETPYEQTQDYKQEVLTDLTKHLRSKETQKLSAKIKEGKKIYDDQTESKKSWTSYLYYAAAAIALLVLASVFFNNNNASPQELYANYSDWSDLPSLTNKGEGENDLAIGEKLFDEGKYIEAITFFSNDEHHENPQVFIYLGLSYLESDDYNNALITFDQLLNSNTLDSHMAYWYTAMTHLKQGNREKAVKSLKIISENQGYYGYEKAKKLLSELTD